MRVAPGKEGVGELPGKVPGQGGLVDLPRKCPGTSLWGIALCLSVGVSPGTPSPLYYVIIPTLIEILDLKHRVEPIAIKIAQRKSIQVFNSLNMLNFSHKIIFSSMTSSTLPIA